MNGYTIFVVITKFLSVEMIHSILTEYVILYKGEIVICLYSILHYNDVSLVFITRQMNLRLT